MSSEEPKDSNGSGFRPPRKPRNFVMLLVFLVLAGMLVLSSQTLTGSGKEVEVSLTEYLHHIQNPKHKIDEVVVEGTEDGGELTATVKDPGWSKEINGNTVAFSRIRVALPPAYVRDHPGFAELSKNISPKKFRYEKPRLFFYQYILPLFPWVILFALTWYFLFRQIRASGGPGNVLSFGKSRARFVTADKVKTTFDDVAGIDEAKEEVREIIEFLRDPQKFQRLGGRIPRGVLLVGPPGTGKTLLAKAITGEANVPFLSISGSDFVEMFVGVGASRVRDVFKTAKENSPCIVFLDEIDAVGRRRGTGLGGGHDEREQTLNQILVEMDGFDTDAGVIILAATNRPDVLDPALLRPGRFDRQITIDLPDVKGREAILRVHSKKVRLSKEVNLVMLARATPMMSGADLASVMNEAAIMATLKKKEAIDMEDLEEARDKVLWGRQKKSRVVIEEEKKITAYHEAGHALVGCLVPECDPVHKVTIIPRGRAGGATMWLPEHDRHYFSRKYCMAHLARAYGGTVVERLFFGEVTSGAQDDIRQATDLARRMVTEWGMSEELGPISYTAEEEHIFLGREVARTRDHGQEIAQKIDREVRRIVDEAYGRSSSLIQSNRETLVRIAEALFKHETLSGEEVRALIRGESIDEIKSRSGSAGPVAEPRPSAERDASREKNGWKTGPEPLPGPQRA